MQLFGPVQQGLPLLSALPKQWEVIIIDIKDSFFSIPLYAKDKTWFAFTLPTINHVEPDKRYQWKVLPQGMANSPTMCQLYVQQALTPVRQCYSAIKIINYMDDILLCGPSSNELERAYSDLVKALQLYGLTIAVEKVQKSDVGKFLGAVVHPEIIRPQKIEIRCDHLKTLNDFQKLLGDINWLRPFLKIPTAELKPLFDILEGDPQLTSPRSLTPPALDALRKVEQAITEAQLVRLQLQEPFDLCIFQTALLPTAVLWQQGPLIWIHPQASPTKTVEYYPSAVAKLALKGLKTAIIHFGVFPVKIITPYTMEQVQTLCAVNDDWAILACSFSGLFDNRYPKHPILRFAQSHSLIFPRITSSKPIPEGDVVYTDGSKTGLGAHVHNNVTITKTYAPNSPQLVECQIVLEVLRTFPGPLNIVSDSCYVVNAVKALEVAGLIKSSSTVASLFQEIQQELLFRTSPVFITHIRTHSGLPGPMAQGNKMADSIAAAAHFHSLFHVTAETLRKRFSISRAEARNIVLQCKNCSEFLPAPHVGVNPRGLRPL